MRALILGITLVATAVSQAQTKHIPTFEPKPGGIVVVYRHQFHKEKWAQARQTFQEKLWPQIKNDHKDVRDSFILESPEHAEIVGITLWRSEGDLKRWVSLPTRNQNQHALDAFRNHPREDKRYRILGIGSELRIKAHHQPIFVPAPGQIVVVHKHALMKSKWNEARQIFTRRFNTQNLKEHTDVRHSFLLESPERAEILSVTLWHNEKEWHDWQKHEAHAKHQKDILPFKELVSDVQVFRMLDELLEVSHQKPKAAAPISLR